MQFRKLRATEHQEQKNLITWASLRAQTWPELKLLFAIPNGGARSAITGKKLQEEGVKPGVPDLFLPVPIEPYAGLFLEMKTAKGRLTADQMLWLGALAYKGYAVCVCHGYGEAIKTIEAYLEGQHRNAKDFIGDFIR